MNNNLKKDLNLFAAIGRERGIGAIDFERTLKKCLVVFVGIFVVVLAVLLIINGSKKSKINNLNESIEALQDDLKEIEQYKLEAESLQADIDRFNEAIADFNVTQRLTVEDIQNVAKCMPAGLSIQNFSFSGSNIEMSVTGTTELMIADFANSLRNAETIDKTATTEEDYHKKNFKDVSYAGVTKNGSTYTGSVSVTLNDIIVETEEETTMAPVEAATEAQ